MTQSRNWVRSPLMYGEPIVINEIAYANGTYLAHSTDHPNGLGEFKTNIISNNLTNWMHVTSQSPFIDISNVKLLTVDDHFIAIATYQMIQGKKLVVLRSDNGFEWTEVYRTDDFSEGYQPVSHTNFQGRAIVGGAYGYILLTSNGTIWKKSSFPDGYEIARVVGSAECNGAFYFLAKMNDKPIIAKTTNGDDFEMIEIPWSMECVTMSGNGSQVVVSCRLHGVACLVFFSDDITNYKTHMLPINKQDRDDLITVHDMLWFKDEWTFVGAKEFYNNGGLKFSKQGFVFRSDGKLTESSKFTFDKIDTKQVEKIRVLNDNLVVFGNSFPNPDSSIFTLEDTDLK